ncbi:sugar phosphate isomerase/epimerase family protein [Celeribacter sp.]|uniref:sugar phosphate isomerase/epimerase family protein n=1 Tax=Celeribacter sp. TaxID=1890673 RepID=UPI003A8CD0B8
MTQNLIYHGLVSRHAPLAIDLEIMRKAGFEGLEVNAGKLKAALDAGITEAEIKDWFSNVDVPGIGFLLNIERHGADEAALVADARELFRLARLVGAKGVQVLTGPVQVETVRNHADGKETDGYTGTLGMSHDLQFEIASKNLAMLADLAAEDDLIIYFEALAWVPLNRIQDQADLIAKANRPNLKMLIDFWHCYAAGDRPEDIAHLPGDLIFGVHICDSLKHDSGLPDESILRDVPTGEGVLNLRAWTEAVKSTGYEGWWSCELFCGRQQQQNSFDVARGLHSLMRDLVLA